MSENSFLLRKWHFDCIAENGDAVILGAVDLRWNLFSFHYAVVLSVFGDKVGFASSLLETAAPKIEGSTATLQHSNLGLEGTWKALRAPAHRTLAQTVQGALTWECLQPMAEVDLTFRGQQLRGLGYADSVSASIPPWQMALKQITWGRYLSPEDAIVWVDWKGDATQQVLHNGEDFPAGSISESAVEYDGGQRHLELTNPLVLRQGRFTEMALGGVSRLVALIPRSVLSVEGRLLRSRGHFRGPSGESRGWAIHGSVRWKD